MAPITSRCPPLMDTREHCRSPSNAATHSGGHDNGMNEEKNNNYTATGPTTQMHARLQAIDVLSSSWQIHVPPRTSVNRKPPGQVMAPAEHVYVTMETHAKRRTGTTSDTDRDNKQNSRGRQQWRTVKRQDKHGNTTEISSPSPPRSIAPWRTVCASTLAHTSSEPTQDTEMA